MISLIVCSVKPAVLEDFKKSVEKTIGVPYELIAIDNSKKGEGICAVYNSGAEKAIYPILCFVHEDVKFETPDWGQVVCSHLQDPEIGLIGLAGGDSKSPVPTSWSVSVVSNEINIYQHYKDGKKEPEHIVKSSSGHAQKKQVVALDGVFLCTRKDVFREFKFDDNTFKGFHGYDIDYSLQVGTRYKLYVIFDIVMHHFSEGTPDEKWVESAVQISKKWKRHLPVSIHPLPPSEKNFYYWRSMQIFLQKLMELNYPLHKVFYYYISYSLSRYFNFRRFLSMGKYLISHRIN